MPRKLTQKEVVIRFKKTHGKKYDYSLVKYIDKDTPVDIICPVHSFFSQSPSSHWKGHGCAQCGAESSIKGRTRTQKDVLSDFKKVHGDRYDYSMVVFEKMKKKVKVKCSIHGVFQITPSHHIYRKDGCRLCGIAERARKRRLSNDEIIKSFKEVHGDKYDYSQINHKNWDTPVEIICHKHGSFFQKISVHRLGCGCGICGDIDRSRKQRMDQDSFIEKARGVHSDRYDYTKTNFVDYKTPVTITCKKHGDFLQKPSNHIALCGCKKCKASRGEAKINLFLEKNKIAFFLEKKFDKCKGKSHLPFDFYLPKYNLLIEYQGEQHYGVHPRGFFGGEKAFKGRQKRDQIKRDFAKEYGFNYLEIPYWDFNNINTILWKKLNEIEATPIITSPFVSKVLPIGQQATLF